jgi:predicted MPP superfamily phosphohydrolase
MAATVRAAAFSCVHAPFFDKEAQRWLNQKVSGLKLDYLICLGDLLEADAASVHPGESEHSLEHEYQSAAGFLTGAREAADNDRCQFIWLLGNHDANIQKRDPRRVPKPLRSLLDWNKHNAEFAKWRQSWVRRSSRTALTPEQRRMRMKQSSSTTTAAATVTDWSFAAIPTDPE